MRFSIYQESRIGGRQLNEDRVGYVYTSDSLLMMVFDGMGGHNQGDMAAKIALQTMGVRFQRQAQTKLTDPRKFLADAMMAAHQEMVRYAQVERLPETPRTTAVGCVVQDGKAVWAHAGDSRLYLVRDHKVIERTHDHSQIAQLVRKGALSEEDAAEHPERNKVYNCLGAPNPLEIEVSNYIQLKHDDRILLCTDGCWGNFTDAEMAEYLGTETVLRMIPLILSEAVRRGGRHADNSTAIGIVWEDNLFPDTVAEGNFATTVAVPGATTAKDMTETAIDQTIAEITAALQKNKT